MIIELEEPFKSKWKRGYMMPSRENRMMVYLYNTPKDRSTISYAKYIYGVHLGYEVPEGLEVDHINNDKTDDRLENLQLLTREQNKKKYVHWYRENNNVQTTLSCRNCRKLFKIPTRNVRFKNLDTICCSRECSYALKRVPKNVKLPEEVINKIKKLASEGLTLHRIVMRVGVPLDIVKKYSEDKNITPDS